MPAPKFLSFLPKPLLFGLYGGAGGLLGALLFGELLWHLLKPPSAAAPVAQVAIACSTDVEVFVDGRNTFPVQVARDGFTGPITIRLEGLPAGVTAAPVTIPEGKTEGEVLVVGARNAAIGAKPAKAVAEATHDGKPVTAESPINFKVTDPPKPLADVVFVLGVAPSMQWAIDDLKNGIGKFADALNKARINYRLGLVTFQNFNNAGPKVEVIEFKGGPFTADSDVFRNEVSKVRVVIGSGGGSIPQSSLEGVAAASRLEFRERATKLLLLVTDAPPSVTAGTSVNDAVRKTAGLVKEANLDALHVVGLKKYDESVYKPLLTAGNDKAGGKYFDLGDVVRGEEGFDELLATFSGVVTAAAIAKNPDSKPQVAAKAGEAKLGVRSLQSGEQSAAGTEGKVVLRSGAWTGAIAALVCLFLLGGQHHYLRGSLPQFGGLAAGFFGGLVVGLIGGAAAQGLFFLAPERFPLLAQALRVVGWALLGGLAGAGLSLFVPNMKLTLGLLGGAIGGVVGCLAYLTVSAILRGINLPDWLAELLGRLVGGLVLGFGIGVMVAVAEAAFRKAWLEVRYGERETIQVTLGPEPVKVGSDAKACTVWARGAPPIALRFFLRDGKVICSDVVQKREEAVGNGFVKEVGNLRVTVRTGSGAPSAPPPARPIPKPAPVAKKPAAMDLDDDDDLNLPMPIAPSEPSPLPPPPPKPAAAKPPVPARPPAPAAIPAPAPVVAPAIKAAAKNPDACPGCSRVIPGKPGARYCMICDQTF